jgi:acetyl-CoA acyltransferase
MTIKRFCCYGLQGIALGGERIMAGFAEVVIAGGTETMSMIPMGGFHFSPNPYLMDHYPDSYLNMGLTAENLARKYQITREQADEFSLRSHQRALAAIADGKFKSEVVPLEVVEVSRNGKDRPQTRKFVFETDEGPRRDTSLEALAKLKPAFHAHGTVTAGNSSQMSDGAAVAMVMSMDKALKLAGRKLEEIDVIELNEAFAAQTLSVIKLAGLDIEKTNVNGGAVALGHPLGCTGAKLTATLLGEMARRKARYGMVTMCIGGGMGAAGIFENLQS